jgi:hypothetical protein
MLTKILVTGALFLSTAALAGEQTGTNLNLDELKEKCVELQSNQQLQPFKVQVTCREVSFFWKPAGNAPINLENAREVGGSIRMKTYAVPYEAGTQPIDQSTAQCQLLHKWKRTIPAVDVELNCQELAAITSLSDFCAPIVEARADADDSIAVVEETKDTYNTCSGLGSL